MENLEKFRQPKDLTARERSLLYPHHSRVVCDDSTSRDSVSRFISLDFISSLPSALAEI